jgi:hypothetical protein
MAQCARGEVDNEGIRVNAVSPGPVAAAMHRPGKLEVGAKRASLRRPGTPEEVASTMPFLAPEEAPYLRERGARSRYWRARYPAPGTSGSLGDGARIVFGFLISGTSAVPARRMEAKQFIAAHREDPGLSMRALPSPSSATTGARRRRGDPRSSASHRHGRPLRR